MNKHKMPDQALKPHDMSLIRNIAIVAHIDAGKTTLTERIIYYANAKGKHKVGEVHDGNTTTDYLEQERERGITIVSAAIQFKWNNKIVNLIDSPGHVDFTIEVERCLSVLEGSVVVIDGSAGVQPQTECVWRQAHKYKVSRLVFINKLDKEGADFNSSLSSLRTRLSERCLPIQLPFISDEKFTGIYDLIGKKLLIWIKREHNYETTEYSEMTQEQKDTIDKARQQMLDDLSSFNDIIMDQYLEHGDVDNDTLIEQIRLMCNRLELYPTLCGSAFHNKGVQPLLDAITTYLPTPEESSNKIQIMYSKTAQEEKEIAPSYGFPVLFCFKWARDRHMGPISYCRIYSGRVHVGDNLYNSTTNSKMRIINILSLFANQYESIKEANAGDIIGLVGQNIVTGDVLSPDHLKLSMSKIEIPESIVHLAIRPKTEKDQDKFSKSIGDYQKEDPTLCFEYNERGQTILKGVGSLQLHIKVERMKTEKGIELEVFPPSVAYRTTITKECTYEYLHRKQTGGAGQFAKVVIVAEPSEKIESFEFKNEIKGGCIPEQYIPAIKGAAEKFLKIGVFNCPVIQIKLRLIDGDHHKVDSSDLAFQEATRNCLKNMLPKCSPLLLEPYAKLVVYTPNDYADKIIGDVCSKGGSVINVKNDEFREDYRVLILEIAMSYTFTYIDNLRCISSGYASCMYTFSGYKPASQQPEITSA